MKSWGAGQLSREDEVPERWSSSYQSSEQKWGVLPPGLQHERTAVWMSPCIAHLCFKERGSGARGGQCYLLFPNLWAPRVTPKASYSIKRRTTINSSTQIPFDHQLTQVLGRLSVQPEEPPGSVTPAEGLLRWEAALLGGLGPLLNLSGPQASPAM